MKRAFLAMIGVMLLTGCSSVMRMESDSVGLDYYAGSHSGYFGRHPYFPHVSDDRTGGPPVGIVKWWPTEEISDEEWGRLIGCVAECVPPAGWLENAPENTPLWWYELRMWHWLLFKTPARGPIVEVIPCGDYMPDVVILDPRYGRLTNDAHSVLLVEGAPPVVTAAVESRNVVDDWIKRQRDTFWHWLRCRLGLPDPYAPEPEPEPDPTAGPIPGSSTPLWKPIGDGGKPAVSLAPKELRLDSKNDPYSEYAGAKHITKVYIRGGDRDGERSKGPYWPTPDPGQPYKNGNRIHVRWAKKGEEYGKGFEVVYELKEGDEWAMRVKDGAKRQ